MTHLLMLIGTVSEGPVEWDSRKRDVAGHSIVLKKVLMNIKGVAVLKKHYVVLYYLNIRP